METENWKLLGKSMGKIFVMLIYVPLMIAAIVCTLFADRIDTVVKGDKKVKKVIIVFGVGVFLICTFAIVVSIKEPNSNTTNLDSSDEGRDNFGVAHSNAAPAFEKKRSVRNEMAKFVKIFVVFT